MSVQDALLDPAVTVAEVGAEDTADDPDTSARVTGMLAAAGAVMRTVPVTVPE